MRLAVSTAAIFPLLAFLLVGMGFSTVVGGLIPTSRMGPSAAPAV